MLLSMATTVIQSAKAALGETILGGLTNLNDQIAKGGNHVGYQITKGGLGFLKSAAAFVGIHTIQLHISTANQDLAKNNTTGVSSGLNRYRMIVALLTVWVNESTKLLNTILRLWTIILHSCNLS